MADSGTTDNEDKLIDAVANSLEFNKKASLLCLGGGEWQFGQSVATKSGALHYIYADNDQEQLAKADEYDILTTYCELTDHEQISSVGKYDGIVMKNSLEKIVSTLPSLSLEDFFLSLYKSLKLNGKAVIIVRIRPTIPVPDNAANDWREKLPQANNIIETAEDCGFECSKNEFSQQLLIDRQEWEEHLKKRSLPFMAEASDEDIENCLQEYQQTFTCNDEMTILSLTKVIS